MSANFAYDQLPPEWDMVNEQPQADDDEFFPPPDAAPVGRPSAEALTGALVALCFAKGHYAKLAEERGAALALHWADRVRQCQEVIEWLDRGAP